MPRGPIPLLAGLALAACTGVANPRLVDPPPGRETVRSIALVVEAPSPSPDVQRPVSGPFEGFLYGSGRGLLVGAQLSLELGRGVAGGGALGAFVWVALSATAITVCTVGGALIGPFQAMSRAEARRRVRVLEAAFLETQVAPKLEAALRGAVRSARPDMHLAWGGEAADATLLVRVSGYGLVGGGGFDPPVAVAMRTETRWCVRGEEHRADFLYFGPSHGLVHWSDHTAEIRDELQRACDDLATRIAEERLLVEVLR